MDEENNRLVIRTGVPPEVQKDSTGKEIGKGLGKLVAVITLNGGKISLKVLSELGSFVENAAHAEVVHKLHHVAGTERVEHFIAGEVEENNLDSGGNE
jgi:hypothetical protein